MTVIKNCNSKIDDGAVFTDDLIVGDGVVMMMMMRMIRMIFMMVDGVQT